MTALDAAVAALDVACAYLELAEQHARAGHVEAEQRYMRARDALVARYREDKQWMRLEGAIKQTLRKERAA